MYILPTSTFALDCESGAAAPYSTCSITNTAVLSSTQACRRRSFQLRATAACLLAHTVVASSCVCDTMSHMRAQLGLLFKPSDELSNFFAAFARCLLLVARPNPAKAAFARAGCANPAKAAFARLAYKLQSIHELAANLDNFLRNSFRKPSISLHV